MHSLVSPGGSSFPYIVCYMDFFCTKTGQKPEDGLNWLEVLGERSHTTRLASCCEVSGAYSEDQLRKNKLQLCAKRGWDESCGWFAQRLIGLMGIRKPIINAQVMQLSREIGFVCVYIDISSGVYITIPKNYFILIFWLIKSTLRFNDHDLQVQAVDLYYLHVFFFLNANTDLRNCSPFSNIVEARWNI